MKTQEFNRMCSELSIISDLSDPLRQKQLDLFMVAGYMWIDLTDKQVQKIKVLLKNRFPDKYVEYPEPDSHGFTAEFEYLRFK